MEKTIGVIGCGNMGEAVIKAVASFRHKDRRIRLRRRQLPVTSFDVDVKKNIEISRKYKTNTAKNNKELVRESDVIILAVKPKDVGVVLDEIKAGFGSSKVLISIAAGIKTDFIEEKLGKKAVVVRVMPNMPALIGAGVCAVCGGKFAAAGDLAEAAALFKKLGEVVNVKEELMDAVTAISASGPAYFFYLAQAMIKAALELGIDEKTARRLVVETALGSAKMLKEGTEAPEVLRARVTSKGGTTEAAFAEFEKNNLGGILNKGIKKAYERARELGTA